MPAKRTKKKTRKGTTKKKHKPALEKKAEQLLRWYGDPDTPMRQLIRGAVQDQRIIGDRKGGWIDVVDVARAMVKAKIESALQGARGVAQITKVCRTVNGLERQRHAARKSEYEFAAVIANTYLAQKAMEVQAAIDGMDDSSGTVEAATRAANPDGE